MPYKISIIIQATNRYSLNETRHIWKIFFPCCNFRRERNKRCLDWNTHKKFFRSVALCTRIFRDSLSHRLIDGSYGPYAAVNHPIIYGVCQKVLAAVLLPSNISTMLDFNFLFLFQIYSSAHEHTGKNIVVITNDKAIEDA